jgi:hypothetical protein
MESVGVSCSLDRSHLKISALDDVFPAKLYDKYPECEGISTETSR